MEKTYHLSIPARINILGNPGDANEGDFATLSAAIDLRAHAEIRPSEEIILEQRDANISILHFPLSTFPFVYNQQHDLLKASFNRLYSYSLEFREKIKQHGFHLKVWSDVPRQSGLGGSSLFILLALAGMRALYQLDPKLHNDYVISELTQRVESLEMRIACGFADRYVPLFGGLAYLDYRGKLHQHEIKQEPYVTYERLDEYVDSLSLVAATTGVLHNSGDVHGQMRPRYIKEYDQWKINGGEEPPMAKFMSAAYETAWRGKIALLEGDLETIGRLMNENHRIINEMMIYCGFNDGAGWANNLFIESALQNGALGAKLTGAGGGGSVFALTRKGGEEKIMNAWQSLAKEQELSGSQIYRLNISKSGIQIQQS